MPDLTVDDLLAEIAPRETVARVLLRQDLDNKHRKLDKVLIEARQVDARENRHAEAPGIAEQVIRLEEDIEQATRSFTFRSVGQRRWSDLLAANPPTKEQRRIDARLDHNPSTFPAAAIAASCVDPKMTVEQVRQFEERIHVSLWMELWSACLDANIGAGNSNLKSIVAGAIHRANAELGLQQPPSEPLEASSSEGL